jgi:SWIM zinc finger
MPREAEGGLVVCDCGMYLQELLPCRHVIAALFFRAPPGRNTIDATPYFGLRWKRRTEPLMGKSFSGTYVFKLFDIMLRAKKDAPDSPTSTISELYF